MDTLQWDDPAKFGQTEWRGWLKCDVEDCKARLPLFEQEPKANSVVWNWESLVCPEGHLILRSTLHGIASLHGRTPIQ
jgi:hypothetical protein